MLFLEPLFCRKPVYRITGLGLKEQIKVALTGDWHVSKIVSDKQRTFLENRLKQIRPDVIILQGDLFDTPDSFRDGKLLAELKKSLKVCARIAPTVLVLGNHDQVLPSHEKPTTREEYMKRVVPGIVDEWRGICRETNVKLLLDSWFKIKDLRIFGFLQNYEAYYIKPGEKGENLPVMKQKIKALASEGVFDTKNGKVNWFAAHAPINELYEMKELSNFKVFSFGHTHGGCLPIGADVLADKLGFHGGIVAPFSKWFPVRFMRGHERTDSGAHLIVNTGMVLSQYSAQFPLRYINSFKTAEVTEVILN